MNEVAYQTLIVKFSEPIKALDGMFDDAEAWGVDTLKGWIDNYESSRFTAIDSHTAVITSERNTPRTRKSSTCSSNRIGRDIHLLNSFIRPPDLLIPSILEG